jgi:hypothetical protein
MSKDMHKLGNMDDATYRKITMRDISKTEKVEATTFAR